MNVNTIYKNIGEIFVLNIQSQKSNSMSFKSNFVKNPFFKQVINRAIKTGDEKTLHNIKRVLNDGRMDEYKLEKYYEKAEDAFGCRLTKNNSDAIDVCLDPSYFGKHSTVESGRASLDRILIKPRSRSKSEISKGLKSLKDQIFNINKDLQ